LVDGERVEARLDRLEELIERLERVRAHGLGGYLDDPGLRAQAERWLQLAIQICIDIGAQLVSEVAVRAPSDYAGVFTALADGGVLERDLAERLAQAARQRNLLVHAYLDIDDRRVFDSLARLDDLRAFAAVAQRRAAAE
jgi:uncharacterized protein YutE (UPF0331/DUF86 family)